jgi:dihydroorotate dehydrogenase
MFNPLSSLLNAAYPLARSALFSLEPEAAHRATIQGLARLASCGATPLMYPCPSASKPITVMGIAFANRVGLAAGADKNGECIDGFGMLGFGFIELGGVTPRPQPGNPQPRMFRLPQANGIINRLGFNNLGVQALHDKLSNHRMKGKYGGNSGGIIGVNLGKNKDTPNENALSDYQVCYTQLHHLVDFATINVSSPNTKDLRALQETAELRVILQGMKTEQTRLAQDTGRYVPLSVKIAPDLDDSQLKAIAALAIECGMDAITATNTTVARDQVAALEHGNEIGGLSGAPLRARSTAVVKQLAGFIQGAIPIIGVGGVCSGADAVEKLQAGASLVQFYSGMIYTGPQLVADSVNAINAAGLA